jgi:hypothetical protein
VAPIKISGLSAGRCFNIQIVSAFLGKTARPGNVSVGIMTASEARKRFAKDGIERTNGL